MKKSKSLADSGFITQMKDKNGDSWYHQIVVETQQEEIDRLTAESTKWESKFYDEAKKVDKAIEYIEIYNEEENPDYASSFINKNDNTYVLFDEYRESLLNILRGDKD